MMAKLSHELPNSYPGDDYYKDSVDGGRIDLQAGSNRGPRYRDTTENPNHCTEGTGFNKDADGETGQTKLTQTGNHDTPAMSEGTKEGFKKGHIRNDSGHVVVIGADGYPSEESLPIEPSEAERDSITVVKKTFKYRIDDNEREKKDVNLFEEKSDSEDIEKETVCFQQSVEGKGKCIRAGVIESELGKCGRDRNEVFPVAYDISKLGRNNPSDVADIGTVHGDRHLNRNPSAKVFTKRGDSNSKTFTHTVGHTTDRYVPKPKTIVQSHDVFSTKCDMKAQIGNHADFAEAIRDEFAELVHADIDVIELCDYLYQYRIMTMSTYEHFFEMSHSITTNSKMNSRRKLLMYLSRSLPRDRMEQAITQAGHLPIFFNVFLRLGTSGGRD